MMVDAGRPSQRHFSIGRLMLVVLVMATNLAVPRATWMTKPGFIILMVLPTINLMLIGLEKVWRNKAGRPFWLGFEVVGSLMVGMMFLLDWGYYRLDWDFFMYPLFWLRQNNWTSEEGPIEPALTYGLGFLIYSGPQLVAASMAGAFSARYRLVRRYPPTTLPRVEEDGYPSKWSGHEPSCPEVDV